jgi:ATP-binding protein involved in chromosome partitioning
MKVAIPTENGSVCPHFGHCMVFTIVELNSETGEVDGIKTLSPPPHERGVIPAWLNQLACTHVIAGGMGHRALALLEQNGVHVVSGVPAMEVLEAVRAFVRGDLTTGANPCDDPSFRRYGQGSRECSQDRS